MQQDRRAEGSQLARAVRRRVDDRPGGTATSGRSVHTGGTATDAAEGFNITRLPGEGREADGASGEKSEDVTARRKDEVIEIAYALPPTQTEGRPRSQPCSEASAGQPRLRQRRGSPVGRDPEGVQIDDRSLSGCVTYSDSCSSNGPSLVSGFLIPSNGGMRFDKSLTARARQPAPRGDADDDVDRRGGQWEYGQADAAVAHAAGQPGGRVEASHALYIDARRGRSPTSTGEPPGQDKRRRIRGKQPVRPLDADLGASDGVGVQPSARDDHQLPWGGDATVAAAARPNSVHSPISAGALRSCCSGADLSDVHFDRHELALRDAVGAAVGIAAAEIEFSGGECRRAAGDPGRGPSRFTSDFVDWQCFSAEDVHDGPQPAASSHTSMPAWAPSGGRPPDGAVDAA